MGLFLRRALEASPHEAVVVVTSLRGGLFVLGARIGREEEVTCPLRHREREDRELRVPALRRVEACLLLRGQRQEPSVQSLRLRQLRLDLGLELSGDSLDIVKGVLHVAGLPVLHELIVIHRPDPEGEVGREALHQLDLTEGLFELLGRDAPSALDPAPVAPRLHGEHAQDHPSQVFVGDAHPSLTGEVRHHDQTRDVDVLLQVDGLQSKETVDLIDDGDGSAGEPVRSDDPLKVGVLTSLHIEIAGVERSHLAVSPLP